MTISAFPGPMDPSDEWRESVLSTRSLSYVSHAGSLISPSLQSGHGSRQPSISHQRRRSTLDSEYSEDGDLEMAGTAIEHLNDIPELPDSVAQSLLFELPREIRDRIYAYCLAAKGNLPVEWPRGNDIPCTYDLQPQLLRTCKSIHDEAAPLLYTLNNLTFHHPSDANMFVHVFASSPMYGRQIQNLSLHIKAQDTRMWMPYLHSTDEVRSLRGDFPNLKELGVRFRSTKWHHTQSPEANMKSWSEDNRLEELIDGLRHVFMPPTPPERTQISEREFQSYMSRNPTALQDINDNIQSPKRLLELLKSRANHLVPRPDEPTIRVCCACRVNPIHFNALTMPYNSEAGPLPNGFAERIPQQPPATLVREGEPFRGFTAIDLQRGVRKLRDPDLGSANVARTPYTDKNGILLALEIHCLEPKRYALDRVA